MPRVVDLVLQQWFLSEMVPHADPRAAVSLALTCRASLWAFKHDRKLDDALRAAAFVLQKARLVEWLKEQSFCSDMERRFDVPSSRRVA
jgi:hypothetical protein